MMEIYQAALIAMEMMMQYTNVVRCAIWYHSYNLKNVKNTYGGVLLLVKPATLLKVHSSMGVFHVF